MFYVRPRRIMNAADTELWLMECDCGEGFAAEDILVVRFAEGRTYAWLIVKDESRAAMEEYTDYVYAVIGTDANDREFELKIIVNSAAASESPKNVTERVAGEKPDRKEIDELFYDGEESVFLKLRDGWLDPIASSEKEKILDFAGELCLKIKSGNIEKEDLLLIFMIIGDLGNHPESVEAGELFNELLRNIKCELDRS